MLLLLLPVLRLPPLPPLPHPFPHWCPPTMVRGDGHWTERRLPGMNPLHHLPAAHSPLRWRRKREAMKEPEQEEEKEQEEEGTTKKVLRQMWKVWQVMERRGCWEVRRWSEYRNPTAATPTMVLPRAGWSSLVVVQQEAWGEEEEEAWKHCCRCCRRARWSWLQHKDAGSRAV